MEQTFDKLAARLSKLCLHSNVIKKQPVRAVLNVGEIRALCAGKADWETISVPLEIEMRNGPIGESMYFVTDWVNILNGVVKAAAAAETSGEEH